MMGEPVFADWSLLPHGTYPYEITVEDDKASVKVSKLRVEAFYHGWPERI